MKLCKGCFEKYDNTLTVCPHCGYEDGSPADSTLHLLPGTLLNDRYIIGRVLGYGGFGVTYIAYDCVLQMKTAVKEYLPSEFATRMVGQSEVTVFGGKKTEQFEDGKMKFIDEARNLAKFHSSEGIVMIFNTFECNHTAYIVMELLEGETLTKLLQREKKIPGDKAIEMLKPVIMSLKEVHEKGIIHRDIAPDNIFITKDGRVKLIDFGAARYATTSHSRSLTVIIKPGYSPEEQYRSRGDQGTHTDVYSMGATLYKMITGVTPPDALERRAYLENKGKEILKSPVKYANDIDENVENAILNAMNVRIEDRTPNMEAFYKELTSEEPVKRRAGKINRIDFYRWPLWAKIGFPTAAVLIVTFLILLYAGFIVPKNTLQKEFIVPEGQTLVPALINKELSKGEERLSEAKLQMEITDKVNDYEIEENYVLTQNIHGGSIVPENTVIQVTVSSQEKLIVPNLAGLNKDEALVELSEMGFVVSVKEDYSSVIAENCIISQSLEADSQQNYGSEIEVVVSKGKDPTSKKQVKEVTLPDFVGKTYDEVIKQAEKLGISIKISYKKYSKTYAKDTVMEQNPKSGSKIKTDKNVELVISLGYEKITVPDVVYMTEEKAKTTLTSRGLEVNVTYKNDDKVAEGNVISQDPKAKSTADPETTVNIVVSKGSASFKMPDVVGKSESNAKSTLQSKGLVVKVTYKEDNSKTDGVVLAQSVKSGTDVKKGQSVTITVCTHSSVVNVPDVVGKTQSEAESAIENKGLTVNVNHVKSDTVEKGRVISQTPAGGSGVKRGSVVTIEISDGNEDTLSSTVTTVSTGSNSKASISNVTTSNSVRSQAASSKTTSSKAASSKTTSSNTSSDSATSITSINTSSQQMTASMVNYLDLHVGETGKIVTGPFSSIIYSGGGIVEANSDGTVTALDEGTVEIHVTFPQGVKFKSQNGTNICTVTCSYAKKEDTTLIDCGNDAGYTGNIRWDLYESGNLYIYLRFLGSDYTYLRDRTADLPNGDLYFNGVPWGKYNNDIKKVIIEQGISSIGNEDFQFCSNLITAVIPDSVTSIKRDAFNSCNSLTSIIIPNSVTSIGERTFKGCSSLTTINIPDSVTSIENELFYKCSSLSTVNIPDSVTSIGYLVFKDCTSLTSVNIPNSVTSIGSSAFDSCTSLNNIYFKGDKPELVTSGGRVFYGVTATVYYPRNNSTWKDIETTWNGGGDMTFVPYDP